jgi:F0F1-type ATP synthase membrane subunit b/b'
MSEIPPIAISVYLQTAELTAGVTEAKAQLESLGGTAKATEGEMKGMGEGIKGLGEAFKAFLALEAVRFLMETGKAAIENQRSMAEMARTMHAATGANKEQVEAAEKGIAALGEMSATMDDKLRPAFGVLYRSTHDTTKALQLQKVALDVAAGTGRDVESVTKAMARAYEGNTGALSKLVPSVKNAKDPLLALSQQFAGAAKSAADQDPYKRMQFTFDKLKESIGGALMPLFQALSKAFASMRPFIEKTAQVLGKVLDAVMPLVNAILDSLMPAFNAIMDVVLILVNAVMPPLMGVFKAITPIFTFIGDLVKNIFVPYWSKLAEVLGVILTPVIKGVQGMFDALMKTLSPLWNNILKPMIQGIMGFLGLKMPSGGGGVGDKATELALAQASNIGSYSGGDSVVAPKTGTSASATAAKKLASQLAQAKKDLKDAKANVREAQQQYAEQVDSAFADYHSAVSKITKERDDALAKAEADHNTKLLAIQKDYANKLQSIVQESMDGLRNAFKSAATIDVGSIFAASISSGTLASTVTSQMKDGIQTAVSFWGSPSATGGVSGLLKSMTDKLNASKALTDNAAKLSGAGFSQTFIEQIVSQGGEVGNKMAQEILASTPETQKALQEVFTESQNVANHGMDTLAKAIYDKSGLATEGLKDLYANTQAELVTAMADETAAYAQQQADIKATFDQGMIDLNNSLKTALNDAALALNQSLDDIEATLNEKLAAMKGKLSSLSSSIGATRNLIAGSYAVATPQTQMSFEDAKLAARYITNNYNLSTTVNTSDSPSQYTDAVMSAIKYGIPATALASGYGA